MIIYNSGLINLSPACLLLISLADRQTNQLVYILSANLLASFPKMMDFENHNEIAMLALVEKLVTEGLRCFFLIRHTRFNSTGRPH